MRVRVEEGDSLPEVGVFEVFAGDDEGNAGLAGDFADSVGTFSSGGGAGEIEVVKLVWF